MTIIYPDSICDAHKSVRISEPVCLICMRDEIARLQREAEGLRRERDEARREIDEMRARHKAWLVDGVSVENDARRYRAICMRARGFGDYTIGIVAEHDHSGHVQRLIGPEADEVIDGLPHPDSETQG